MDSLRGDGAGAFVGDSNLADGVGVDEVSGDDEVVCVPLADVRIEVEVVSNNKRRRTMSSASSGRSVMLSCSASFGVCRDTSFIATNSVGDALLSFIFVSAYSVEWVMGY